MTIDEMMKLRQEAQWRIQAELMQLQEATGMQLADLGVRFIDVAHFGKGLRAPRVVEVRIDLRVP